VLQLLLGLAERGKTVLMVTHDARLAARADLAVTLVDGRVASVVPGGGARA